MEKENLYVAPQIEVIEVEVEKGFAVSGGTPENLNDGGQWP